MKKSPVILFDGVCSLCNKLVLFIIKRDPKAKFKFASLQSEIGKSLLLKTELPTNHLDSIILIDGEQYFLQSTAALRILKELNGGWKAIYIFLAVPKFLRDFIYNSIAKTRYRIFGKEDACMIPTTDIKKHFLG